MKPTFFTTKDPLDNIIKSALPNHKVIRTHHIITGWTNIVIEVETDHGTFFFRFPRNPFWSKMIVKDAAVCNFVENKTSFYTPQMTLHRDEDGRPFTVHQKIHGYSLNDRIYHLSHSALTASAYSIAKFIKELSSIDLSSAPESVKYPLADFLKELDDLHYETHLTTDHNHIKSTATNHLVHGDLNLGNILLDNNDQVIGVIDFCFAGTGNPNMDISRVLSRPTPPEFASAFLNSFDTAIHPEIDHLKSVWSRIDAGYADHIRTHFPEITLPSLG